MLSLYDRFGRREVLRVGGLALGGLGLPGLCGLNQTRAADPPGLLKDVSVVFLFMQGGPSQIETFDPKMDAPTSVQSATGELQTRIPGITFGGTLPKLAALADQISVVRSFQTGDGNHDIKPIVGRVTSGANLGVLYSRMAGPNQPGSGMPTNVVLYPRAVDDKAGPQASAFGNLESTGTLGAAYAPFAPSSGGEQQENLKLKLPMDRLDDRRQLLTSLDTMRRSLETGGFWESLNGIRSQAFKTIFGSVSEAFDLSKEDPATIAAYDTEPLIRADQISKKWNNHPMYTDHVKSLGKLMLLARRLVERGTRFVTINTNFVWDMHADINNAGVEEGMRYMGIPFDHAVSTFIKDLQARGLTKKVLLVCCGEMGRTPGKNAAGGRDHWGNLAPLLISGGGLQMGQVIGQSTRDGGEPLSEPMTLNHLVSTVMHTMFDVGQLRVTRGVPMEIMRAATAADPIPGLV